MTKRITKRSESSGRTDDNMESLKKRFKTFEEETLPIIDYFEKKGKVIRVYFLEVAQILSFQVDGAKEVEEVSAEVESKIKNIL